MVITGSCACAGAWRRSHPALDRTIANRPPVTPRSNSLGVACGAGMAAELLRRLANRSIIKAIGVTLTADRYTR